MSFDNLKISSLFSGKNPVIFESFCLAEETYATFFEIKDSRGIKFYIL